MGLAISIPTHYVDDGNDGNSTPETLPFPYWVKANDERFVALKTEYQVPKLIYIVCRNGVPQEPKEDYQLSNPSTLEFFEPLVIGERVSVFAVGFSA